MKIEMLTRAEVIAIIDALRGDIPANNTPEWRDGYASGLSDVYSAISNAEATDPQRYGRWNRNEAALDYVEPNGVEHHHGICSECGLIHDFLDCHTAQYNYCPQCGAKMEEPVDGKE